MPAASPFPLFIFVYVDLLDLVDRARKQLLDACACIGCEKRAHVADTFTCETCQEALNGKPVPRGSDSQRFEFGL